MENEIKDLIIQYTIPCGIEDGASQAAEAIVELIARQSSISASAGDIASELKAAMRLRRSYIFARGQNTGVIAPPTHRYLRRHTEDVYIHWKNLEIDIQNLLDSQPVDKVRAMAALVSCHPHPDYAFTIYSVPCIGDRRQVWNHSNKLGCDCSEDANCIHIQAVKLYLAAAAAQEVRG